jgi:hypothetical protein
MNPAVAPLIPMARDFLACQAASVGVERVFVDGRDRMGYRKGRTTPETLRSHMIIKHHDRQQQKALRKTLQHEAQTLQERMSFEKAAALLDFQMNEANASGYISDDHEDSTVNDTIDDTTARLFNRYMHAPPSLPEKTLYTGRNTQFVSTGLEDTMNPDNLLKDLAFDLSRLGKERVHVRPGDSERDSGSEGESEGGIWDNQSENGGHGGVEELPELIELSDDGEDSPDEPAPTLPGGIKRRHSRGNSIITALHRQKSMNTLNTRRFESREVLVSSSPTTRVSTGLLNLRYSPDIPHMSPLRSSPMCSSPPALLSQRAPSPTSPPRSRSPSPARSRSVSPARSRSLSPARSRSPSPARLWSPSPPKLSAKAKGKQKAKVISGAIVDAFAIARTRKQADADKRHTRGGAYHRA